MPYDPQLMEADFSGLAPIDVGGSWIDQLTEIKENMLEMIAGFKTEE
jgi:CO dehydrogenase maturation factor